LIGGLSSSVGDFLDNPSARELFEKFGGAPGLSDAFLSVELAFLGVAVSIFGLQAVLRARSEEVGLRAEPMLANATTRVRWLGSHLVVALTGSVALLAILGVAAGLTSAASVDTANQFWRVVGAALVQAPAVFVMIGIGIAGFGISGRLAVAGWAALGAFVVLGEFGVLLNLPQWIIDVAPFAHTPRLPGVTLSWTPVVWLTAVAAALILVGLSSFRRRDLD
jgi:ABC-2 type transport system permease protein